MPNAAALAVIAPRAQLNAELVEIVRSCYADPLRFVQLMYPWGEAGTMLESHAGPDRWQEAWLADLGREVREKAFDGVHPVMPILRAVSKGHGVGGTVLAAWLVNWIMSTRPNAQGVVTANTAVQLETKTWATIQRWTKLCLTGHWFVHNAARLYHPDFKDSWFCTPQTCREENSEAFAGQHASDSTSFYVLDEDSAIPEIIHQVAEGGLTDGEPMMFRFGNPTRNSGSFHTCCFGAGRDRWHPVVVDARASRFTNKDLIAAWIAEHGEDSDFVRVRVRGLPPRASDLQYIDLERIRGAQEREVVTFDDEPLVVGVDFSGGGKAWNVVRFRRGLDARSVTTVRVPGERTRGDRTAFLSVLAELLRERAPGKRVSMMFCDSAYGAPYVERLKTMGFANVMEVTFGGPAPDAQHYGNMRAYMWAKLKDWLLTGALPDDDPRLEADLSAPGHHLDRKDRLLLESKESLVKRGVASPDDADALCFVAGTLVETEHGEQPIEMIQVGDRIRTPCGLSRVVRTWSSDALSLTTVRFSHGHTLIGKGEHEVFTFSRGKVRMDALSLTDEVEIFSRWRLLLWQLVTLCSIGVRRSGFKAVVDTFSPATAVRRRGFCIVGCGWRPTARFQQTMRSIIATATGAITGWRTWSFAALASINGSTWPLAPAIQPCAPNGCSGWRRGVRRPLSGTVQQGGELGTLPTASAPGLADSHPQSPAPVAASASAHSFRRALSSAPRHASRPSRSVAISLILWRARTAAVDFWRTAIGRRPIVPVSVQTVIGPGTKTYNLTLAQHNAYYANGILVFNCLTFAAPVVQTWKLPAKRRRGPFRERVSHPTGPLGWMG